MYIDRMLNAGQARVGRQALLAFLQSISRTITRDETTTATPQCELNVARQTWKHFRLHEFLGPMPGDPEPAYWDQFPETLGQSLTPQQPASLARQNAVQRQGLPQQPPRQHARQSIRSPPPQPALRQMSVPPEWTKATESAKPAEYTVAQWAWILIKIFQDASSLHGQNGNKAFPDLRASEQQLANEHPTAHPFPHPPPPPQMSAEPVGSQLAQNRSRDSGFDHFAAALRAGQELRDRRAAEQQLDYRHQGPPQPLAAQNANQSLVSYESAMRRVRGHQARREAVRPSTNNHQTALLSSPPGANATQLDRATDEAAPQVVEDDQVVPKHDSGDDSV